MSDYYSYKSKGLKKRINKKKNAKKDEKDNNCRYHDSHKLYRNRIYPHVKRSIRTKNRSICSVKSIKKFGNDFVGESVIIKRNTKHQIWEGGLKSLSPIF